jgi:hypothetical protein
MGNRIDPQELEILLKEYAEVNNHYLFATKQKATLIHLFITIGSTMVGALFLNYMPLKYVVLLSPILISIFLFIYGQKETEYWIALLCLEQIEKRVNNSLDLPIMSYITKYKRYMFPRPGHKLSTVFLMQYVRVIPGLIVIFFVKLYQFYGFWVTILELGLIILSLYYIVRANIYTQKDFLNSSNEE